MENKLNSSLFYPEVYQAVAGEDYIVYAYVNDGSMRKVDVKPFIEKGGVFKPLRDKTVFTSALTVIGYTIAWDLIGNRNEYKCIDIDPFYVYNSPIVDDIP
ncbi:MAG: DUF2442 domain-containing protein [Clostridiales bacterium]|nr:DUF2442 domain-containing protein [Clostridiales bacterium]MCD8215161.1 DUF2442 domain-containing protein [Clostridiales bacterium]